MKKCIASFVIVSFLVLTVMANMPSNATENVKNQFSNPSHLTDVQMEVIQGQGFWACLKAVVAWGTSLVGVGAAASSGNVWLLVIASGAAGVAYQEMGSKCNFSF